MALRHTRADARWGTAVLGSQTRASADAVAEHRPADHAGVGRGLLHWCVPLAEKPTARALTG